MNNFALLIALTNLLFLFVPLCAEPCDDDSDQVSIVETKSGKVKGFAALNGTIDVFFGIPYAQPPLGKLRFQKTHDLKKWHGTLNATQQRKGCYPHTASLDANGNFVGNYSEDCLILNIFCPHNKASKLPVLSVIHGGGFESGDASQFSNYTDIGRKFVQKGIVFVAIQYRLGQLGFASTGDEVLPGNLGLWDQRAALKWIHANIRAFGGDPAQVTLYGDSAGAKAVSALSLSPHSRDLFKRVIQMSGSSLDCAVTGSRVANETLRMASILGCPVEEGPEAVKNCLNGTSAEAMMRAVHEMGDARREPNTFFFTPRFDGDFFPKRTTQLVKKAPAKATLIGFNKLESLLFTLLTGQNFTNSHQMLPWSEIAGYGPEQFRNYVSTFVATEQRFGAQAAEVASKIFAFYSARGVDATDLASNYFFIRQWTEMISDIVYIVPVVREARAKAARGWPVFLYRFDYVNVNNFPAMVKIHESYHTNDLSHLFRLFSTSYGEQESAIEAFMVTAVRNFIKKGNPSTAASPNQTTPIVWPRIARKAKSWCALNHVVVEAPEPVAQAHMGDVLERVEFWAQLSEQYPQFDLILEQRGEQ